MGQLTKNCSAIVRQLWDYKEYATKLYIDAIRSKIRIKNPIRIVKSAS